MVLSLVIFLILLISLFILARKIIYYIYATSFLLFKSKKLSLAILLLIILPGTIIHEMSHFLIATLLFVPVGKISIIPTVEEGSVKAGSVHHAKTDIIRGALIGLAPIIVGLLIIYVIGTIFLPQLEDGTFTLPVFAAVCYLLFATSITMFSSKKDLETTWFLGPILIIVALSLYFAGIRLEVTLGFQKTVNSILSTLNIYLFLTFILNGIAFIILKVVLLLFEKVLKRRIVIEGKK